MERQNQAERDEQARFFNQPHSNANFSYWSKAAYWTLDEATALSFGKAPNVVNWASVKGHVEYSSFAHKYALLKDLIDRAKYSAQLSEPTLPTFFIAWAKQNAVEFPPDLEAAVVARGRQVANWKSLYEDAAKHLDAERRSFEAKLKSIAAATN